MKKFFFFFTPFLIAIAIFFGTLIYLNIQTGKGALKVSSSPNSKIYLNDQLLGSTPFCACEPKKMLNAGEYTIRLVPVEQGYKQFEHKININKSTLTVVEMNLDKNGKNDGSIVSLEVSSNKNEAEIQISSFPDKANVFLDNIPVGITPLQLRQISEADHEIRITKDGYKDKIMGVKSVAGYILKAFAYLTTKVELINVESTPSASPTVVPVAKVSILDTPTGFLRVRKDSSVGSSEIGRVNPGEFFELLDEKKGWFEIKFGSSSADVGWISSQYASKE